jgi:hypothetical protein
MNDAPTVTAPPSRLPVASRRADTDAKQAALARILTELDCEGAILLVPAHLAWFAGGLNVRGLFAESERPGIFTNGRMRWLVCGNADTHRLFDEDLNGLGFMLKEWQWPTGRAQLLADLVAGKKIATDRPFPGMPLLVDRLRSELRMLYPSDHARLIELGQIVAHAVEATARGIKRGDTEQEIAGQLAHRTFHHGAEVYSLSVTADQRGRKLRRSGFTATPIETSCTIQLTAVRNGLHATASRTVCFGTPSNNLRTAYDTACKVSALFRSRCTPGQTLTTIVDATNRLVKGTEFEHEWRLSTPVYGGGWFAAEELRRAGQDELFVEHQSLVGQTRFGPAAVVDTVIVTPRGAEIVTPPEDWPYKRIMIAEQAHVVADILVRQS